MKTVRTGEYALTPDRFAGLFASIRSGQTNGRRKKTYGQYFFHELVNHHDRGVERAGK